MTEKTLTTENIKPALDALRGELAPWPVVAKKQDRLNTAQLNAANSGITSSLVAQIIANTAAIRALESAITGTGLRALVVASLPAVGTTGILYIVPVTTYDPDTDADVVNYSNEYIWIPVEGGTDLEGHYEQVGQTGIVINNGQLTITVNGTSVGTFTANQSGDTTAAITVPTNADYVDRTTDQTVAGKKTWTGEQSFTLPIVGSIAGTAAKAIADEDGTSIKTGYVNVAGNQTVSGDKSFTGSNTFNNILPNATNTYSLGSSSYQWSSVYAQSYYYNGTAWGLDKANTWTDTQTYSTGSYGQMLWLKNTGLDLSVNGNTGLSYAYQHMISWVDKNNTRYSSVQSWTSSSENVLVLKSYYRTDANTVRDSSIRNQCTANAKRWYPESDADTDLGTSTHKWKTLNGVNPGALSLPDVSKSVTVDIPVDWVTDGSAWNALNVSNMGDGWLCLTYRLCGANDYILARLGGANALDYPSMIFPATLLEDSKYYIYALLPVTKAMGNIRLEIKLTSGSVVTNHSFYPGLGNV